MRDTTPTADDTATTTPDSHTPEPVDTSSDTTPDAVERTPNAEAARYRVRLREAEKARDDAMNRLAAMQTAEVERIAAATLAAPADLFTLGGDDLTAYLDESGNVDADAVTAAAERITADRPGLARMKYGSADAGPRKDDADTTPRTFAHALAESLRQA